jgi:gentisate 1,2-dioxygenase
MNTETTSPLQQTRGAASQGGAGADEHRQDFYDRIDQYSLAPIWKVLKGLIPGEPTPQMVPHVWDFAQVSRFLVESGSLVTAAEAERRVLALENPALRGKSLITDVLFGGLQLIMPHEIAPAHRHSQSALRFVLDGQGAYTSVQGEKTLMMPGDFIITPPWTWHDHGNETKHPMIWLDVLDISIVAHFRGQFREEWHEPRFPVSRQEGDALARYGSGLMPIEFKPSGMTSPVFNYPYERTREALYRLSRSAEIDPYHGHKLRFINPVDGGWAMPTIATWMQWLPQDFQSQIWQCTDGLGFACKEGSGETRIFDALGKVVTLAWKANDVFVVPGWLKHTHHAFNDTVLFGFSDRSAQEKLGLWRERKH